MSKEKETILEDNSLDSLERVKTLSPGMMIVKRFFRNKLALVGLVIIAFMFLFSFLGGIVSPYTQAQVFRKNEVVNKEYAGASLNETMSVVVKDGCDYTENDISMAVLEYQVSNSLPKIGDDLVFVTPTSSDSNIISKTTEVGKIVSGKVIANPGFTFEGNANDAYTKALKEKKSTFTLGITKYGVMNNVVYKLEDVAITSYLIYSAYNESDNISYDFRNAAELMISNKATNFVAGGRNYEIEYQNDGEMVVFYDVTDGDKKEFAIASKYTISSITKEFLSVQFKLDVIDAIKNNKKEFTSVTKDGKETKFTLKAANGQYTIKRPKVTQLNDIYAKPSKKHLLGTDGHGMDMLTRIMYGGRISLLIGFVVVILEMVIGVTLGGLAGYFGKWVDTVIMRMVELFNCIPTMPLYIIIGTILDARRVDSTVRMYILAILLAAFYWTGIARMVRGQILSLREQEFMVATEAMGIKTSKRIFKHLIPNVMPQLIVIATMDLGSIILTEASLSFLGLGVKFPLASWGAIINAVNSIHVMKNFWWVWIPAGICILLTVLGFNFIGDGLRDAFDPKMKR